MEYNAEWMKKAINIFWDCVVFDPKDFQLARV